MNYDVIPSDEIIINTSTALSKNNFEVEIVNTKEKALEKIKKYIPDNVSVMNGSSMTLKEIGYIDYLREGNHRLKNLHKEILEEKDITKQQSLRMRAVMSDYYLGGAHLITETGEIVISSNSGSQLPHLAFTSKNIILVVGAQKITKNIMEAFERLDNHVVKLEDERARKEYGVGTMRAKTLILHKENPMMGRKVKIIIVKEKLGF